MIPTVAQVFTRARSVGLLDDADADVFTDAVLAEPFAAAYQRMIEEMLNLGLPRLQREVFYNLPAYTAVLFPATAGISDFGELVDDGLEERDYVSATSVTGATGTPIILTATGHGRATGDRVQVHGVAGETGANGEWLVGVSGVSLTLNGSVSEGTYTAATGTVTYATEGWSVVDEAELSSLASPAIDGDLKFFEWRGDAFRFVGANIARQLRITYLSSGNAPASGSVGVDGSLDFLATYTAAAAGAGKDRTDAGRMYSLALGSREDPGGLLHRLVNPMVKAQQRVSRQPQSYAPRPWGSGVRRRAPYIQV